MRGRFRFGTLESRFYLTFTLIFFIVILGLQVVSFRFTVSAVRDATTRTQKTLLDELVVRIDTYIADMERIADITLSDPSVSAFLAAEGSTDPSLIDRIGERLSHYAEAREDVSAIFILRSDGETVSGNSEARLAPWSDIQRRDWYVETMAAAGDTVVSGSYVQNILEGEYPWVVSVSKRIVDRRTNEDQGILLVDLRFDRIREICESLVLGDNGYTFIVDPEGVYVFHPAQQMVYSGIRSEPLDALLPPSAIETDVTFREGDRRFMLSVSNATNWRVVSVADDADVGAGWGYVQVTYAITGLILFIIIGVVTNFISQGITRPLRTLQEVMRSVETGEFVTAGYLDATDEVKELAREYDMMVGHIRELMAVNLREQELKRKSDLKALQAQINPHFLYNTLDSIVWMAEMNKSPEVVMMTSALSKLFRISISRGLEFIPLRDEVEHVRSYLTIQQMRYEDKFRYEIDIDESLLDITVLKIILQPLVENAIYHGIRDVDYPGLIRINGEIQDELLRLRVEDNGAGMNEAERVALISELESDTDEAADPRGQGVGIRNVHERIRIYYGEGCGLDIASTSGKGTVITCRLPAATWEGRA